MSKLEIKPKSFEILDANDPECKFKRNIDVLNECFGLSRGMYMRASYPYNGPTGEGWISGTKQGDKFFVWMPKLYSNSSEWNNSISDDKSNIYELASPDKANDYLFAFEDTAPAFYMKRLVFVKESINSPYSFAGVFVADTYDYKRHIFKRIATKVKVIGDPVSRIEILD